MRFLLAALVLVAPVIATAQSTQIQGPVTSSRMSVANPGRYVVASMSAASLTVANGAISSVFVPWPGRLVDVIVYQTSAGVGGTSYTVDVKTVGGTSLLTTLPVITLASGVDKLTDAKSALTLPSGWTRPVVKTDAAAVVTKGTRLLVSTIETGTYSTHAAVWVALVFDPS